EIAVRLISPRRGGMPGRLPLRVPTRRGRPGVSPRDLDSIGSAPGPEQTQTAHFRHPDAGGPHNRAEPRDGSRRRIGSDWRTCGPAIESISPDRSPGATGRRTGRIGTEVEPVVVSTIRRVVGFLAPYRGRVALALALTTLACLLNLPVPLLVQALGDRVVPPGRASALPGYGR